MSPPPDGLVEAARGAILDLAGERANEGTIGLQPSIFDAYRRLSGDPDEHLAIWLREGAPLGINRPVLSAGIFPSVPNEPVSSEYVAGLARTPAGWEKTTGLPTKTRRRPSRFSNVWWTRTGRKLTPTGTR